ncbi:MAG TPA: rhomboid family intramembrane serine protease [Tepidisphaeraceae bacterium]|jgi:membrane associated rhomboid family serine protease
MTQQTLPYEAAPIADRSAWLTVTRWLVVVNVVIFLLDWFVINRQVAYVRDGEQLSPAQPLLAFYGSFSYVAVLGEWQFWRLLTYQFCHANVEHIVVNLLGLLLAGPIVEEHLGRLRFLLFYLACGIAGPIAHLVLTGIGVMQYGTYTPLVGASASIYGLLVAAAMIAPAEMIELLFPPIDVKLRTLALLLVGLSFAAVVWHWTNAGGHAAHLGGAVAGYLMMRRLRHAPAVAS